jgi:hypothetical protein
MDYKVEKIIEDILIEFSKATSNYGEFHSPHEGYSIILEELEELWEEIKKSPKNRDYKNMRKEAIQLTAMSLRFIYDMDMMNLTCLRDKSTNGE